MRASFLFFANAAGVEEPSTFFRSVMKNVSTPGPFQYAPFENANDAATKDRIDMTFFRLAISRSKWTVSKLFTSQVPVILPQVSQDFELWLWC
jgi:hypothetical protein